MAQVSSHFNDTPASYCHRIGERRTAGTDEHTGTPIDAPFHFFVSRFIHNVEVDWLSIGGFDDLEKESAAHRVLVAKRHIIEDIFIPETIFYGRARHFTAFSVLIKGAGEAWSRAVAWDEAEMA